MPTQNIYDLVDTWNAGATTFTAIKMNVTDTASASGSLLMDLQVGGVSQFKVSKAGAVTFAAGSKTAPSVSFAGLQGGIYGRANGFVVFSNGTYEMAQIGGSTGLSINERITFAAGGNDFSTNPGDTFFGRRAAANLRLGAADAAAPVAQTLGVQSVTGVADTAGATFTIAGSQGTGTGAGGSIVFQVAPAGSSGTAQNALATALTIGSDRNVTLTAGLNTPNVRATSGSDLIFHASGIGATWRIANSTGHFLSQADNTYDIGASGARPRDIYAGSTVRTPQLILGGGSLSGYQIYGQSALAGAGFEDTRTGSATSGSTIYLSATQVTTSGHRLGSINFARTSSYARECASVEALLSENFVAGTNQGTDVHLKTCANGSGSLTTRLIVGNSGLVALGTALSSSFPALKRSSTTLQARLADDSGFASVQGKITTDTAYTAGDPTTTGYLVIYDSNGTAYKVPAVAL